MFLTRLITQWLLVGVPSTAFAAYGNDAFFLEILPYLGGYSAFLIAALIIAWIKNRSLLGWFFISILLSPLISILILFFLNRLDTFKYNGEPSLENDSYKLYLIKKYDIQKNEVLNKIVINKGVKVFDSIDEATYYAHLKENMFSEEEIEKIKKSEFK